MKFLKENITTLLFVLVAILVTLQITSMLKGSHPSEKAIRNEIKLEQLEERRINDSVISAERISLRDSVIAVLKRKEPVFVNQIVKANEKIKDVTPRVNHLSIDSLLQSAIDY